MLYTVVKSNGAPYHWSDVQDGWADYPIFLRRDSDAMDVAKFLKEKFGSSQVKMFEMRKAYKHEEVPALVDGLDVQLALWIAESKVGG